ncbi:hypothetical protein AS9A_3526 [Hoyosella subflava DQS3-9A1]|uniref:Uncharacterized protein n=1 Tax=Hoyosella subflava (strain DSM 45089 / JCM 17490 / NBRC 109087 / DQS3-9A1) TaxID=443218 RepID=F6ER88_HOYSD|nr:hypothetical protein AS9A_3526 [Hoyosella subflava DQS3-9A1]
MGTPDKRIRAAFLPVGARRERRGARGTVHCIELRGPIEELLTALNDPSFDGRAGSLSEYEPAVARALWRLILVTLAGSLALMGNAINRWR